MIECECERWRDGTTVCPMHGTVKPAAPIVPAAMLTFATALAELLIRRGDSVEARRLLHQALELQPSDNRARVLLQSLPAG